MKYPLTVIAAAALFTVTSAHIIARQGSANNDETICYPKSPEDGITAPCVEIANIASACQPNGTAPLDYEAHAQCMCNGSYFSDWVGCQQCLIVHGLRSERDVAHYKNVLSAASHGLCTGTPTAAFPTYFESAGKDPEAAPYVTTGNTASSDEYPGKTAISLYYSPTVSQGAGVITGSAVSATHRVHASTTATADSTADTVSSNDSSPTSSVESSQGNGSETETQMSSASETNGAAVATQQAGLAIAVMALVMAA